MPDGAADPRTWDQGLPQGLRGKVVVPVRFETYIDAAAHARKVVGLDRQGRRCYLRHGYTLVEERFDIDEFPLDVPTLHERRIAWRLTTGLWLLQVVRIERLDSCRPTIRHNEPALLSEAELGF